MRLRPFILCFYRTAISIQKIDSKSSKSHLKSLPRISPKSYRHNFQLKAFFNFAHKQPTFAFTGESGYTLGFQRRIAHKGTHSETGVLSSPGHSMALCYQRNSFYSTVLLYTYISRFSVTTHYQQREKIRQSYSHKFYPPTVPHCVFQLLPQTPHVCFHVRKRVHTRLSKKNRTQGHTRRNKGISDGVVLLPSERSARSRTSPGRVSERQTLPLLDLGRVYSRRTQRAFGTAMRLCASLFRGVAAPLGCVIFFRFCRNCGLYTLFQIFFSILQTLQLVLFDKVQ